MSPAPVDLDRRTTLARPDLANGALEGLIRAERFAAPRTLQVAVPAAGLYAAPDASAELDDQALFGELVDVLEVVDGWAWGQARRDGYVGFLPADAFASEITTPTHWVSALRAYAFEGPNFKSRAIGPYSLNALVTVEETDGDYLRAAGAGWFHARHLRPLGEAESDFVVVAERFAGTPYLWGGRDSLGLDCSGLVQQALYACARACPRDADMQAQLGAPAPANALARGDLVCWSGHIGIMQDPETLLHANVFAMSVVAEPLSEAVARIAAGPMGPPTAYRRLG